MAISITHELANEMNQNHGLGGVGFHPNQIKNMVLDLYKDGSGIPLGSNLFQLNKGIVESSFDEKQILRILSYPGCAGVRCYLALTDKIFDPVQKKCVTTDTMRLTIVMVGINKHGEDIIYEFPDNRDRDNKPQKFVPNCECSGHEEPGCPECDSEEIEKIRISFVNNSVPLKHIGNRLLLLHEDF
jgi:hypothetical protein